MQIKTRLTLQFLLVAAVIMAAAFTYIYAEVAGHLLSEFQNVLRSKANLTGAVAIARVERDGADESFRLRPEGNGYYTENVLIFDDRDYLVYSFSRGGALPTAETLREIRKERELTYKAGAYQALGQAFLSASGREYVVIAEGIFNPRELRELRNILMLIFVLLMLVLALGGWLFARHALAPINRIMNQVEDILPSDLSMRLFTENKQDELARLVVTFNKLLDRLEAAFLSQNIFLANLSHELKNPITVIATQADIILQRERDPAEYREALSSILRDIRELNHVSDQLMQLSRLHAGNADLPFELIRLDELIWNARDGLLKAKPSYTIQLEIANLPESECDLYYRGNETLLRTALMNIMDNGCKFSPDKRVELCLSFNSGQPPRLEIRDSGPGIPEEELRQIFDPFFRGTTTRSAKGSGIGLSLVSSIVRLHGIILVVENSQPEGTLFQLDFLRLQPLPPDPHDAV